MWLPRWRKVPLSKCSGLGHRYAECMGVEVRCVTSHPTREEQTPGSLHRVFSVPPRPAVFQHWLLHHPESWPYGAMKWSPRSWVGGTSEKRTLAMEMSGPFVTMALLTCVNGLLSLGCLAQLSATRDGSAPLCVETVAENMDPWVPLLLLPCLARRTGVGNHLPIAPRILMQRGNRSISRVCPNHLAHGVPEAE